SHVTKHRRAKSRKMARPGLYCAFENALGPVRYYEIRIKFAFDPEAIAFLASAKGRIERKRSWLKLAQTYSANRTSISLGIQIIMAFGRYNYDAIPSFKC